MQELRAHFPSLSRADAGRASIFLDGPAGTQVPRYVSAAMTAYYDHSNANTHGFFPTSTETDGILHYVRDRCAALVNAPAADCISFGQNMTSLAFKLSRAFSRILEPGDEVLITQLDHEANRGPWLYLEDHGIVVSEIVLKPDGTLDYADAANKITSRTKLVAAGWGSNILGTVNDIAALREMSREVGAWLLIDAVHYAPHFCIDVAKADCDFLLCSAYKFYGPHVGILYTKPGLLDSLPTDRLRTAGQKAPERIETGTLNHAAIQGVGAAIDFIAMFGQGASFRERLESAFEILGAHEHKVGAELWNGLKAIPGVTTYGIDFDQRQRCPTIAFTIERHTPAELCKFLGARGVFAWDGHFYAIRTTEVLDLLRLGGVTRMGIVGYNTSEEVAYTLSLIREFVEQ